MEAFTTIAPAHGEVLEVQTAEQRDFRTLRERAQTTAEQLDWLHLKHTEQEDLSIPRMLEFAWKSAAGCVAQCVEVAEEPDFSGHVMRFAATSGASSARVHSLKTGTRYRWRVVGTDAQGAPCHSAVAEFLTADATPRWVFIEGVPNVRDLGGWRTRDGRRVRQGCIYRGGEFNSHNTATPEGLRFAERELGLRTDLDIRGAQELAVLVTGGPALPSSVRWVNLPLAAYADIDTPEQRGRYAAAFRVLADPANYPIYMHCWGGADRTGTLALLLNAALGVPDEELLQDYEMTALATWGARSRENELFREFLAMLEQYAPGQDLRGRALAYWKAAGITSAEVEQLAAVLLE